MNYRERERNLANSWDYLLIHKKNSEENVCVPKPFFSRFSHNWQVFGWINSLYKNAFSVPILCDIHLMFLISWHLIGVPVFLTCDMYIVHLLPLAWSKTTHWLHFDPSLRWKVMFLFCSFIPPNKTGKMVSFLWLNSTKTYIK